MNNKNYKKCFKCSKTVIIGNNRSHSMRATKRRIYPNLHSKLINGKQQIICTRCLRTLNK